MLCIAIKLTAADASGQPAKDALLALRDFEQMFNEWFDAVPAAQKQRSAMRCGALYKPVNT